ncbi:hypothetical protein GH5_02177 [Leishmania sp. Ghana 2012 LV757]|uniref:hypothetical protein n=1 Tax=Leishmania sp. Ghana 2012 LV757 TaxID=2803181 RepID=UPI001B654401|nr:hypothetical protein GH5_02177 [Leishmania sp. Ghana 2012 LV757]
MPGRRPASHAQCTRKYCLCKAFAWQPTCFGGRRLPSLVALSLCSTVSSAQKRRYGHHIRGPPCRMSAASATSMSCREVPSRALAVLPCNLGSRTAAVEVNALRCPHSASAITSNGITCPTERRTMPLLAVWSSTRHMTSSSHKIGANASARRRQWYSRQLNAQTLCPVDVMPLAQRTNCHPCPPLSKEHSDTLSTSGRPAAIADVFLSCCASPLCQAPALLSIFKQLSADQQCDILSTALISAAPFSKRQLGSYVEEALSSDSFSPAHWVRLVTNLSGEINDHLLPWTTIAKRVLCSSPAPFSSNDDACAFIARVLSCMEAQGIPGNTIAQCMETCGLSYEACAYASSSSHFVPPPERISPERGWGFGDAVHSISVLPEPPMRWLSATCCGMPRVLRRYTTLVLLRSIVQKWGVTDNHYDSRWRRFAEAYMTTLEAASAVHFLFGEGNAVTAQILLPYCHTQHQIVALMRYTSRVTVELTLAALKRAVELRTARRSLAHIHLTHRTTGQKVNHIFRAQAEHSDAALSKCSDHDENAVELFSRTLSFGLIDLDLLRRCLHEVLPAAALARSHCSLAHLLAVIPASAVEHVVNFLGTLESDALSSWASLYIEAGNFEGAFAVLEATAARGRLPHMGTLVMLLEALRDDRRDFQRAVNLLQSSFSPVSETVLRAFVERTAANITGTKPVALSTRQAMHVLSAFSLMGMAYFPTNTVGTTAAKDVSSSTASLLALAEVGGNLKMPAPLHVGAIEGLIAASWKLGYDVSLTVHLESASGECCGSWASTTQHDMHPS